MPTATKLVSALIFAAIGYFAADMAAATLEEGISSGLVREIAAVLGVFIGWSVTGTFAPRSLGFGLAYGLNGSAVLVILTLLVVSASEMIGRSLQGRYDGPMEGLEAMIEIGIDRASALIQPTIMAVLILGGLAGGLVAHAVSRVWR